ncbi:MAG TPA: hypothetical protein PLI22_00600 [Caldisericia bacterium]|nr:hypothetical protein [Caldisericia bacterium]
MFGDMFGGDNFFEMVKEEYRKRIDKLKDSYDLDDIAQRICLECNYKLLEYSPDILETNFKELVDKIESEGFVITSKVITISLNSLLKAKKLFASMSGRSVPPELEMMSLISMIDAIISGLKADLDKMEVRIPKI